MASSEALIKEVYIDLRRRVNSWASITKQTAQARMGYIGQHLTSVATGYQGGRSGARGYDLILPEGYAEIKTCYRVDQLGSCQKCDAVVASIELKCHSCGSDQITRKDDSKWLIGIRNETEYAEIIKPLYYYLVLFEFEDLSKPTTIVASIWRVDPKVPGFAYAMIDYKENIKSNSKSGAPFNLWPHSLKFQLMRPLLIYRSRIFIDDTIITDIFPGRDSIGAPEMIDLAEFSRSRNLTEAKIQIASTRLGFGKLPGANKKELIASLIKQAAASKKSPNEFADALAYGLYHADVKSHFPQLPSSLRSDLRAAKLI